MKDQDIYYSSFIYLLHNITPNLRFIIMRIDRERKIILFDFIYENHPSDIEKELAEDITSNVITLVWNVFKDERRFIVSTDPLENVFHNDGFLLYARYER